MRNVVARLNRHRLLTPAYPNFRHVNYFGKCISLGYLQGIQALRRRDIYLLTNLFHQNSFSTGYSSVHGERPSAEYAKLRKQLLENEFGHALGTYRSKRLSSVYHFGPFLAVYRAAIISFHVLKLTIWQFFVHNLKKRAIKFRETLIRLGPFYIKLGQALSTRPDILPTVYCQELARLQDKIPPFPTHQAIKSIENQLGRPVSQIFADISPEPIAAASLGQVYKAHLHSGELVAVKVQRPGMSLSLTLDALLFQMIGGQLKRFAKARKDLLVAVNEMVRHMFDEIDYVQEGKNAERFCSLYGCQPLGDSGKSSAVDGSVKYKTSNCVKVPKIYWDFTRTAVLTMEWIDGIKLTDEVGLQKAHLNRRELIDQGLYCSLRQLLEVGVFHADPHPGNLVATEDGSLAYFDFGMMGDIPRHYRVGLIQVLVHFVNRDSLGLANDFLSLGFIPEGVDIRLVSDALNASFGDGRKQSLDFQGVMNQLYSVMYEFNFCLPPDYALVIRALGSLEGTAKVLDPEFKVLESAYPFVIGRLLEDPNPDMRRILRELLIRNDGSIRWNRLERLVAAISEQAASESSEESLEDNSLNPSGWKSFDMAAVVAATEDLFLFIFSKKGSRVRIFLLRDIIGTVDIVLQDEVFGYSSDEKHQSRSEDHAMLERVVHGFQCLRDAIKLAPQVWMAMLIRMALKPEVHSFSLDVISSIMMHIGRKIPDHLWVCISRFLHDLEKDFGSNKV
ncbi:unnamed protein product [Citrullus colocynthis]|uniref:ABC1 atypical kinase-like domain-containing protein n=1 Tax=Citrullus colocynthis TaxID=252529 RepID=A0ABP0XZI4_9ROSI